MKRNNIMEKQDYEFFNVKNGQPVARRQLKKMPEHGEKITEDNMDYFVCQNEYIQTTKSTKIGVLPKKVDDPCSIRNIESYIMHLEHAGRRVVLLKSCNDDSDTYNSMTIT